MTFSSRYNNELTLDMEYGPIMVVAIRPAMDTMFTMRPLLVRISGRSAAVIECYYAGRSLEEETVALKTYVTKSINIEL